MENCSSCHGTRRQKGNLNLQAYDSLEALTNDADRWEIVVRKLRDGDMPPEEEEPRPTPKQIAELTGFVEREIAKADAARPPDPGRVTTRRLNRTEYNNTIRDLLGVDLRPADEFPNDDSGYGFDNIGDVLSTSPLLMEKQLAAAERIARTAIFGIGALKPSLVKLPMLNGRVQESKDIPASYDESGLTMANAAHATYRVPVDAEYVVRLITSGRRPQGSMPMRFALWLDGTRVGEQELDPSLGAGFEPGEQELSGRRVEFRLKLKAGEHWIAGTPLRLYEGLPPKLRRAGAVDAAAAAEAGVQAASRHDARADRVREEAVRGAPHRAHGDQHAARRRHRGHRPVRLRRTAVAGEPGAHLHLPACRTARRRVPAADRLAAGAAGLPPAGDEGRGRASSSRWPSASSARRARSRKAWRPRCRRSSCRRTSSSASSAASRASRPRAGGRRSASA